LSATLRDIETRVMSFGLNSFTPHSAARRANKHPEWCRTGWHPKRAGRACIVNPARLIMMTREMAVEPQSDQQFDGGYNLVPAGRGLVGEIGQEASCVAAVPTSPGSIAPFNRGKITTTLLFKSHAVWFIKDSPRKRGYRCRLAWVIFL
jgi:hypothetical protein